MSGLGGLNKSRNGVVIGMVQLQLPLVETLEDLAIQTHKVCDMVGKARRQNAGMDLVVDIDAPASDCLNGQDVEVVDGV